MILFYRTILGFFLLLTKNIISNPVQEQIKFSNYCHYISIELFKKNNFTENSRYIQSKDVLKTTRHFINILNQHDESKKSLILNHQEIDKQARVYLSAFIIHYHPLESLDLQNKQRTNLNKISHNIIKDHISLCKLISTITSHDEDSQRAIKRQVARTNNHRIKFDALFENYVKSNNSQLVKKLIESFISIEKIFLTLISSKKEKTDDLTEKYASQLVSLKKKIDFLDRTNGLVQLDYLRQKEIYPNFQLNCFFIPLSMINHQHLKKLTQTTTEDKKSFDNYIQIYIDHHKQLSFETSTIFKKDVFKKLLLETILDMISKKELFNFKNLPAIFYPYHYSLSTLIKINTYTFFELKQLLYQKLVQPTTKETEQTCNKLSDIATKIMSMISEIDNKHHAYFYKQLEYKKNELIFHELSRLSPLKKEDVSYLTIEQFSQLSGLHLRGIKLAFINNALHIIEQLSLKSTQSFSMTDFIKTHNIHVFFNEDISQIKSLFRNIMQQHISHPSIESDLSQQQRLLNQALSKQISFKHMYRYVMQTIKTKIKTKDSYQKKSYLIDDFNIIHQQLLNDYYDLLID